MVSIFWNLQIISSRENLDGRLGMLLLLVPDAPRALLKPQIPNPLIRRIFELKAMVLNGEYSEYPPEESQSDSATLYLGVCDLVSPGKPLYLYGNRFRAERIFQMCGRLTSPNIMDREFYSLEVLKTMVN